MFYDMCYFTMVRDYGQLIVVLWDTDCRVMRLRLMVPGYWIDDTWGVRYLPGIHASCSGTVYRMSFGSIRV